MEDQYSDKKILTGPVGGDIRSKLWLWGHKEGIQNGRYGLEGKSKITPADACEYMGLENLVLVREYGEPKPPYGPHMELFQSLSKVVWSLVGAGGTFEEKEIER